MSGGPYAGVLLEHFRRPRNYGALPNATVEAEGTNPLCGDRVRMALALDANSERIEEARFTANACAICVAAASLLTERLHGMVSAAALATSDDDIIAMLGAEIPDARRRCATLPLETVRRALRQASTVSEVALSARGDGIVGLILAAGSARRFGGSQKLLAEVRNGEGAHRSLVRLAAVELQRGGLQRILVVLGRDAEQVRERLAGLELEIATNDAYAEGMSTSLTAGIRAALERWPNATGLLIALGDQPVTDDRIVPGLLAAFGMGGEARIIAPRYRGVRGNPVVFHRELVPELLAITGDQGARDVVARDANRVWLIDFDCHAPVDVDTPEDLVKLANQLGAHSNR